MATSTQRPVRLSTFQVYFVTSEIPYEANALSGEFLMKSDVHYCAEKSAIDAVVNYLENCPTNCPYTYLIYKTSKELNEDGHPKNVTLISKVYSDNSTRQVVID